MVRVFSSGSCRLLTTINDGHEKIEPVHSMFENFHGINFLGKLHNTKQHIQFIRWLLDEITLPETIISVFLTSYGKYGGSEAGMESKASNPLKKAAIRDAFFSCDWYIFEICSLKLYEKDGYQVHFELTDEYTQRIQTVDELYEDLYTLRALVPSEKPCLFQTHFRPNIIYNDSEKCINKRECIYTTVSKFCDCTENTYIYDPSVLLANDSSMFDGDTHFVPKGHMKSFEYIYENYINKRRDERQ